MMYREECGPFKWVTVGYVGAAFSDEWKPVRAWSVMPRVEKKGLVEWIMFYESSVGGVNFASESLPSSWVPLCLGL